MEDIQREIGYSRTDFIEEISKTGEISGLEVEIRTRDNLVKVADEPTSPTIRQQQESEEETDIYTSIQSCSIACKEARETHYWLRLLVATEIMPEDKLTPLTQEADELVAILTSIIKNTKGSAQ